MMKKKYDYVTDFVEREFYIGETDDIVDGKELLSGKFKDSWTSLIKEIGGYDDNFKPIYDGIPCEILVSEAIYNTVPAGEYTGIVVHDLQKGFFLEILGKTRIPLTSRKIESIKTINT